jgi:arylsulfatase A-like enzyme
MFSRGKRLLSSLSGAAVAAFLVAWVEAKKAVPDAAAHGPSLADVYPAEAGVLVPFALAVGLSVGLLCLFLEPSRPHAPQEYLAELRAQPVLSRARTAALLPLVVFAGFGWCVAVSELATRLLASGDPLVRGVELGLASMAVAAFALAAALALVLPLRRVLASCAGAMPRFMDPVTTGGLACVVVLAAVGWGMFAGDLGGRGGGPLGMFGVLRRSELDLGPLANLAAIALSAYLAPAAFATLPRLALPLLALVSFAPLVLTVHEASALNQNYAAVHALEHGGLGKVSLTVLRKLTDRDHDGFSPYFGGGDCDDHDPRRYPTAIDVPGNGIDEDCSGEDTPLPAVAPVVVRPPPDTTFKLDPKMSLVLITVDTMKIDLGFMGYDKPVSPNLDAIAARGVVFDRAYSMASYTGKSVGPLLIGKYPSETARDAGHFNTYYAANTFLAERLHDAGFHTMGAASHWYFVPWSGLTQGMDEWDTSAMPGNGQGDIDTSVTSEQLSNAAIRLLDKHTKTDPDGRFFLWVHYFDPHEQYMPHPEAPPEIAEGAETPAQKSKAAYDAEVWFTDHHIGRLLDFIGQQPWGGDTAVVVTSDHGETFGEHGMSFHGGELWEPLVRVPLIVFFPGARPHHVPVKRSHIDLVPTLLDLLGVPQPPEGELSGKSMLADLVAKDDAPFEERDVYIDMPVGPYTGMRHALITGPTPGQKLYNMAPGQFALYDLAKDPGELEDLALADRERLMELVRRFNETRGRLKELSVTASAPAPTTTAASAR